MSVSAPVGAEHTYPAGAQLRVGSICRTPKNHGPLIDVTPRTFLRWVAEGKVPAGRKIGSRTRVWTIEQIRAIGETVAA